MSSARNQGILAIFQQSGSSAGFLLWRPLMIVGFVLSFSSCSTLRNPVTSDRAAALRSGEGLVAATFSSKGMDRSGQTVPASGRVTIRAKGLGANKSVKVIIVPQIFKKEQSELVPLDGFGGIETSDVVAIPLPEGEYEIFGWTVVDRAVTADLIFSNRLPLKVPFQVKAGETTYLGRMNSLSVYGKNLIGLAVPGEALVIVSDQYENDAARIAKKYPSIPKSTIRRSNVPAIYMAEMKRISNTPSKFFGMF